MRTQSPTKPEAAARGEWRLVGALTVLAALALVDKQIFALLATSIKRDLSLTDTQLSILLGAAFGLANILVSVPAGYLADRFNRRGMVAGAAAAWSMMTAACGVAHTYPLMFLARAGLGLAEGLIPPAAISMIRDGVAKPRLGRALSLYASANMTGAAIALLLGGALLGFVTTWSFAETIAPWRIVLIVIGLGGLPLALLPLLVREPPRQTPTDKGEATFAVALAHMRTHAGVYAPLMVFAVAHAMVSVTFGAWLPSIIERSWGLSPQALAFPLGLMMLTLAPIGLWLTGWAIDTTSANGQIGAAPIGIAVTLCIGVAAVSAPSAPSQALLWWLLAFLMLVGGTFYPIVSNIIATLAPPRAVGKIVSIQIVLQGLIAGTTAPTIAALVGEQIFNGAPTALAQSIAVLNAVYCTIALTAIIAVNLALMRRRRTG